MASAIGSSLSTGSDTGYLAGLLDRVGEWWNDRTWWEQLIVGAGIAALVVASGGSLGLAMGVSGVAPGRPLVQREENGDQPGEDEAEQA